MKKLMVVCAIGAGLMMYACGGNENKTAEKKKKPKRARREPYLMQMQKKRSP